MQAQNEPNIDRGAHEQEAHPQLASAGGAARAHPLVASASESRRLRLSRHSILQNHFDEALASLVVDGKTDS